MSNGKMLSFQVKFVQTDRRTDGQTDNGKTICPPNLSIWGHKKAYKNIEEMAFYSFKEKYI